MNADVSNQALNADESERLWRYSAPELISAIKPAAASIASDCYALGCLLWEVLTCQYLWEDLSLAQVRTIMQRHLRPSVSEFFAPHISALLNECWSELPAERPLPAEILHRLAVGKNAAYLYLPNSTLKSSLRHSKLRGLSDAAVGTKSVTWALPEEPSLQTNAERKQLEIVLPSTSDVPGPSHRDSQIAAQPLNVPQPNHEPHSAVLHYSPLSGSAQSLPCNLDVGRSMLQLQMPSCGEKAILESPRLHETIIARAPEVIRPSAVATQFSLNLAKTFNSPENSASSVQKQLHDAAVRRAAEHVRSDSIQNHSEIPAARSENPASNAFVTPSTPRLLQATALQQPGVIPPTTISSSPAASLLPSLRHRPTTTTQISLVEQPFPSKSSTMSCATTDAASSVVAHDMAPAHLQSTSYNAAAHANYFERSVL